MHFYMLCPQYAPPSTLSVLSFLSIPLLFVFKITMVTIKRWTEGTSYTCSSNQNLIITIHITHIHRHKQIQRHGKVTNLLLNVYMWVCTVHSVFVENVFEIPWRISNNNIGNTLMKSKSIFRKFSFYLFLTLSLSLPFIPTLPAILITHTQSVVCFIHLECAASHFQCFDAATFHRVHMTFMPLAVLILYKFALLTVWCHSAAHTNSLWNSI